MTGYTSKFAIGKTPKILQGINTLVETRKKISKQLELNKPFTQTIINYRKNKEEYLCMVSIFPIKNINHEITHFIALEKEIA